MHRHRHLFGSVSLSGPDAHRADGRIQDTLWTPGPWGVGAAGIRLGHWPPHHLPEALPRACRRGPAGPVTAVCTFAARSLSLSGEGFQVKAGLGPLIFFLLISSTTVCIFSDRPELSPPQFASY